LRLTALAQIAGNLGEADERSIRPPDRIDDDMGPEPLAILPYTPALAFELPGLGGGLERPRRKPRRTILLGVEARKMRADDLSI
jgi:hypothetical protein